MICPKCGASMSRVQGYGSGNGRWVCSYKITRSDGTVWFCDKTIEIDEEKK